MVEKCTRHGREVYVRSHLKGLEDKYDLCSDCAKYKPYRSDNCELCSRVAMMGFRENIVIVIWECSDFKEKNNG